MMLNLIKKKKNFFRFDIIDKVLPPLVCASRLQETIQFFLIRLLLLLFFFQDAQNNEKSMKLLLDILTSLFEKLPRLIIL